MSNVLDQPLAFVDIETTGGSHFNSRVLEVAVVRVERNRVVATYQTLLYPDMPIPKFITSLTGITDQDVVDAPTFAAIADELAEILEGAVFVAHNVRFDYAFLKMEFERLGAVFAPALLCTVRLSRRLFPQYRSHKLSELIKHHQLQAPSRHRAYDDAHCLWQFYQVVLREFDLDTVEAALRAQLHTPSLPGQLDPAQVEALPEGPGVYIFEDEQGAPLYVGKSVTVKRRVMSHFAGDYKRSAEMKLAQEVKTLRAVPTHGELSALLLESDLVKELLPKYNRLLRRRRYMVVVFPTTDDRGYASILLSDVREIDPETSHQILAVYATKYAARQGLQKIADEFGLCPKLIGLEHGSGGCFWSQIGKCGGACKQGESPATYNARFAKAFERHRIAAWPYQGPLLVREQHPNVEGAGGVVIDSWCLVAQLREFEDGSVEVKTVGRRFDLDQYRIIRGFLASPAHQRLVRVLTPAHYAQMLALA